MNEATIDEPIRARANARAGKSSFDQKIVLGFFTKMRNGSLHVDLPDGTVFQTGVEGESPAAKIRINDVAFFKKCVLFGDIGFGEAYMEGLWDTPDITEMIKWFLSNLDYSGLPSDRNGAPTRVNLLERFNFLLHLLRPNTRAMSKKNISEHYDLGNEFYELWLDKTMTYSSGLFRSEDVSLEDSQHAKYASLCSQLSLQESDHVLEIGCGWGGFCCHAAKNYGCRVTAVTISKEQFDYARARVLREGLEDRVTIMLCDYRDIRGSFTKIASIEMLEAVGHKFLPSFFAQCHRLLTQDGLLGLQYITIPDSKYKALKRHVDWIQKHIFPGSLLLSVGRINDVLRHTSDLSMHSMMDMGQSYARTLMLWRRNFNEVLDSVRAMGFSESFIRKWNYYLSYCEAGFAMRNISVVQAIYTRACNRTLSTLP
jgi:cyclopropane-fatty-acyl-phospholipid synthase